MTEREEKILSELEKINTTLKEIASSLRTIARISELNARPNLKDLYGSGKK